MGCRRHYSRSMHKREDHPQGSTCKAAPDGSRSPKETAEVKQLRSIALAPGQRFWVVGFVGVDDEHKDKLSFGSEAACRWIRLSPK